MAHNPRRPYFNDVAPRWDQLPGPPDAAAKVSRFIRLSGATDAAAILDVGCGTGVLVDDLLKSRRDVRGLVEFDIAFDMLKVNAAKFPAAGLSRVCGDAQDLPFAACSFDVVLCFGVFPHFDDKESALRQIFRVVRPGGALCIGHMMGSREMNAFHRTLNGPVSGDSLPSSETLSGMIRAAGAAVVAAEENPGWYFVKAVKQER